MSKSGNKKKILLVGLAGIDAETDVQFDGLVKLRFRLRIINPDCHSKVLYVNRHIFTY